MSAVASAKANEQPRADATPLSLLEQLNRTRIVATVAALVAERTSPLAASAARGL